MIYIIFAITGLINVFNILLLSNNTITQNRKEKVLLITYSIAELVYILFCLAMVNYTATNTVIVLSFIIVWLLSKSYILVTNMNFNDSEEEVFNMNNNINLNINEMVDEETVKYDKVEEIEIVSEVEEDKLEEIEIVSEVEKDKLEETEIVLEVEKNEVANTNQESKIELSDLVENAKENVFIPTSLHALADIIESAKINKEEEQRMRRRSLALRASKMMSNEQSNC